MYLAVVRTESQAFVFITLRVGGKSSRLSCSPGNQALDTLLVPWGLSWKAAPAYAQDHTGSGLVLAIDEPQVRGREKKKTSLEARGCIKGEGGGTVLFSPPQGSTA